MGCCISKCRPEDKHSLEEEPPHHLNNKNHVIQNKLVISQAPPSTLVYSSTKISPSPPSPTSSTSSISSFTCTTSNTISSASSSLSTASSSLTSNKDRSFSNDFLFSCYKDNPHISRINSLREATLSLIPTPTKPQYRKINTNTPSPMKPNLSTVKHSPPQNVVAGNVGSFSMPQKRVRSNSPTNLTRQKSFRKETERCMQSRTLGSPSPSRRFNGDNGVSKRMMNSPKVSVSAVHSHSVRKESVKVASPNNSLRRFHSGLRQRESCGTFRVGSKIDETVVKDVESEHDDMDVTLMEDIDNPLISLDCFIFL